jgi:diguanylate cyclase (GGDEF)-like protein
MVFMNSVRRSDVTARYGGDEFAVVATHTKKEDASSLAKRIRLLIEQTPLDEPDCHLTVSIGVAAFPTDGERMLGLIEVADKMLYEAKRLGKNRVCLTGEAA